MYTNVRMGLASGPRLVPISEDLSNIIKDSSKDWYVSLYHYNDSHKQKVDETGSVAGIKDTVTNTLYFDFDSKDNIQKAKDDAIVVANRLIESGFVETQIHAYFTGNKGFSIEVPINEYLSPEKFKAITQKLAGLS